MHDEDSKPDNIHRALLTKVNGFIIITSEYIKYFLAICIFVGIILSLWSLPHQLGRLVDINSESLIDFLRYAINMIIALELIHVLCHQTLDTIIEVLLIAATREMIINNLETWEMLFGALAIAVLFAVSKFLYVKNKSQDTSNPDKVSGKKQYFPKKSPKKKVRSQKSG